MEKIPFEDGTKIKDAVVEINEQEYTVTPAQYTGNTPLTAANLNLMQDNIEEAIDDTILGVKIAENSSIHMNQYLKLFSVNMSDVAYKTDQVLFRITNVQSTTMDEIFNLTIYKGSPDTGISIVRLEQIKSFVNINNLSNLIAILEDSSTVSVYLKIINTTTTPYLKILSYMKYTTETLTIYSEQYVDSLPSGTQYQATSKGSMIAIFSGSKLVSTSEAWVSTKLLFDKLINSSNMTLSNNNVVIGTGIKKVLVILKIATNNDTPITLQAHIRKNGSEINDFSSTGYNSSMYSNLIAFGIIDVKEGDTISGYIGFSTDVTDFSLHKSTTIIVTEI